MRSTILAVAFGFVSSVIAAPTASSHDHIHRRGDDAVQQALESLVKGNEAFRNDINTNHPGLLEQQLVQGQKPTFNFLGCSDSRASEGTIFDALPGTFFTHRNIANVHNYNAESGSWLGYGVEHLNVTQVVVVGHYGCGGVAAAIASRSTKTLDATDSAVEAWIDPIRELYATSTREEIVAFREAHANDAVIAQPAFTDSGYRALIEEHAKHQADRIHLDPIIQNIYNEHEFPRDVFIHTWVYDIESGNVVDLKHSYGPPGKSIVYLADVQGH
ncbi:hypothetical protein FRB99_004057 [Tulasnella sp. 403]|nr:hypothetical protein FRB99_004057 [Tulasnella sp. 403]